MMIVTGDFSGAIKFWDFENGELVKTIQGHNDNLYSLTINENKHFLISGSYDMTIKLWNCISGK